MLLDMIGEALNDFINCIADAIFDVTSPMVDWLIEQYKNWRS